MTVQNPPGFLQSSGLKHPASEVRRALYMLAGSEGVAAFTTTDLKVTASGTPDNHVHVARGGALVQGDDSTDQGLYAFYNDGDVSLTVPAADVTNPRKDIVIARIKDTTEGQSGDTALLDYIAGTPAGSPSLPSTPATALLLATVDVPAGGSTVISNSNITDKRMRPGAGDAQAVATSQNTASTSYTDLSTVGPAVSVTVPSSGKVRVFISCYLNNSGAYTSFVGVALSGANTVAAADADSLYLDSGVGGRVGISWIMKGLTPGVTTFTLKYKVSNGTGTFKDRKLTVEPCLV